MLSYPERAFLPHDVLANIVRGTLQPQYPKIFSPEYVQPVGIDIAGCEIKDVHGNRVEPQNERYLLHQGTYQVHFGFEIPLDLRGKLEPLIHWRTSSHRCGVLGGPFFAFDNDNHDKQVSLFGGKIVGNFHVFNPYGVKIDVGARLAQLSFTTGCAQHLKVTEMITPFKIETFSDFGIIGLTSTTLPPVTEAPSIQTTSGRVWELVNNTPYQVTLGGNVLIGPNEVMLATFHMADYALHPKTLWYVISTALGDPGFQGLLSVLLVPAADIQLSDTDGICRFTSIPVVPYGDRRTYQGQWAGHEPGKPLILYNLREARLTGVTQPSLVELAHRAFER